ncbi:hypothetical protein YC2023_014450 [Brassica napus]
MAFDKANAEDTPSLPPDMSSPSSSLANLSFITSISETNKCKELNIEKEANTIDSKVVSKALASSASSKGRAYKCIMGFIFKWNTSQNVSFCLSSSSNRHPGVRHSTFESRCLGRSSQSIAYGFLRFWDTLNFKKDIEFVGITVLFLDKNVNSVIHGFTPVGRANHYMPSLKADSIVKVNPLIDEVITGAPEIILLSRLDCSKSPTTLVVSKIVNSSANDSNATVPYSHNTYRVMIIIAQVLHA